MNTSSLNERDRRRFAAIAAIAATRLGGVILRELEKMDTPAGKTVVSSILREQKYRRR